MQIGSPVSVPSGRQGTIVQLGGHCPIVLIQFDDGKKFWMPTRIVKLAAATERIKVLQ